MIVIMVTFNQVRDYWPYGTKESPEITHHQEILGTYGSMQDAKAYWERTSEYKGIACTVWFLKSEESIQYIRKTGE